MEIPTLAQIEELVTQLVLPFYQVERDLPLPIEPRRRENDAEHTWSLTFIACALAPQIDPSLDIGLVSQLATVHDLVEVYAGDASTWDQEALKTKTEKEAEALRIISERFGHFSWVIETIQTYERKDTNEARYIWALDKFLVLIFRRLDEGHAYIDQGLTKEQFEAGLVHHREKAHAHPGVAILYEAIRKVFDAHPEYFAPSTSG